MTAGIYVRVSKADSKKTYISNSIENQLLIINKYIAASDIGIDKVIVFKDNGYSGRNGKRPAFRKLLADMFLRKIDVVIVKDFSRLSREHLLISEIREIMCPKLKIRLIAVSEEYDSSKNNSSNLLYAFRSLFDEYYCYDISMKVKSSLEARKEEGGYSVAKLPYGYRYDGEHKIKVNEKEAEIIKAIYNKAAEGLNNRDIATYINDKYNIMRDSVFVWRILNNPMYAGVHVWHKYENNFRSYGEKRLLPDSEWRYKKDKNAAIIDEGILKRVKNIRGDKKKNIKKGKRHIFHGITKCGECGKALVCGRNRKNVLVCRNCTGFEEKRIETGELYDIIINILKDKHEKNLLFDKQYKELFIQTIVKKVYIYKAGRIDIYWNFAALHNSYKEGVNGL